jgi:AcrR family transcriptional regulator
MVIPVPEAETPWVSLDPAAKRERLLCAASDLFIRDGLDAPMPAVAAAAGAGIASVYRQFPSKRELLAALVTRRLEDVTAEAALAAASEEDSWTALVTLLRRIVERQSRDDFMSEARVAVADHPDVRRATGRATRAFEKLLARARASGRLREDASVHDLRLLFAAARAAEQLERGAWRRMFELLLDSLERQDTPR